MIKHRNDRIYESNKSDIRIIQLNFMIIDMFDVMIF